MTDEHQPVADESARVSRLASAAPADRTAESEYDAIVREYQWQSAEARDIRSKVKAMPRSYSTSRVSDDERLWATFAHASVWITAVFGVFTLGTIIPISIFVPLVIYFLFRRSSEYVAFHALQAFVLQLLGTVGALTLLVIGGAAWLLGMVAAALSVLVLVGFVLVPLWGIVGLLLLAIVVGLPLAMLLYGTIAAIATYKGQDYRYPYIAHWVDRQLAGGLMNAA